jgi:hypothetical protein
MARLDRTLRNGLKVLFLYSMAIVGGRQLLRGGPAKAEFETWWKHTQLYTRVSVMYLVESEHWAVLVMVQAMASARRLGASVLAVGTEELNPQDDGAQASREGDSKVSKDGNTYVGPRRVAQHPRAGSGGLRRGQSGEVRRPRPIQPGWTKRPVSGSTAKRCP